MHRTLMLTLGWSAGSGDTFDAGGGAGQTDGRDRVSGLDGSGLVRVVEKAKGPGVQFQDISISKMKSPFLGVPDTGIKLPSRGFKWPPYRGR